MRYPAFPIEGNPPAWKGWTICNPFFCFPAMLGFLVLFMQCVLTPIDRHRKASHLDDGAPVVSAAEAARQYEAYRRLQ